ncbi:MAG: hypothetical protein CMG02_00210 [Candidatus Marinimicrobia bacterium]|nr:hypothetical protein [Candidatus Neomarinimicrobiota bacterium]|tara:strand:+ start:21603 stop:23345 length:1743 start_codon:yes stop_codon:yes gene_type:complete
MKNLIILDNCESVKIFKSNKENYKNNLEIVCLNYSAKYFLSESNIKSKHIYEFFKQDELDNIKETSENKLNEILNKLDAASSKFKRDLKLDFDNFFYDFFKNRLFKTYPTLTLLNIFISLKLKENYDIVYFYDDNLTNKAKIPIIDLIKINFKNEKLKFISHKSEKRFLGRIHSIFWAKNLLNFIFRKIKLNIIKLKLKIKKNKHDINKILLLNYDFELLKFLCNRECKIDFYKKSSFIKENYQNKITEDKKEYIKIYLKDLIDKKIFKEEEEFFVEAILKYLSNNIHKFLNFLNSLKSCQKYDYIIWRSPPVHDDLKSLLLLYCLKNKIKIIGFQHGAHYIETNLGNLHFDQDFNKCNFWVSFRYTEKDYIHTYKERKKNCKIISSKPSKSKKIFLNSKKRNKINNILYPPRQSHHAATYFYPKEKILYNNQIKIFQTLENLENKYFIKLIPSFSNHNCWYLKSLKKLKLAKIIKGISLKNYYEQYNHSLIILDSWETSLLETIDYNPDSEIYVLHNYERAVKDMFLDNLPKNVKIFKDINDFVNGIKNFKLIHSQNKNMKEFKDNFSFPNFNTLDQIL